ncbi:MAG: hypothetical protein WD696_09620 [Bryobacteraceae bacterium]
MKTSGSSTLPLLLLFAASASAQTALTVYNQNFGVIRDVVPLDLMQGVNQVRYTGATAYLEPESVILRDPAGKIEIRILEQNYRADPVSVEVLLTLHEGKTIDFLVREGDRREIVPGKIVRSGRAIMQPASRNVMAPMPPSPFGHAAGQPIVEIDGKLRFELPGVPLFPPLSGDQILKPSTEWVLQSAASGKLDAELCYVSGGLNWEADYNVISPEAGEALDLIGWVTIQNYSGKTFENARIKLMAGDVNKILPRPMMQVSAGGLIGGIPGGFPGGSPVTEKSFDEYHLYTLQRPATLRDRETKQVEFLRAAGVKSLQVYVYEGAKIDRNRYPGWQAEAIRNDATYGTQSNPKVWVMREFVNSTANRLGMPLPQGRVRFYRRDSDGRLEFTGEDTIRHTPRDETLRVFTGAAFDLIGERKRTNYRLDHGRSTLEETFEIKLRNRKKEAVEVKVVERLYRWSTWEIHTSSSPFQKTESQTVEFQVPLQPDEEKTITYAVRYTW